MDMENRFVDTGKESVGQIERGTETYITGAT